jgi:hypothetical protein
LRCSIRVQSLASFGQDIIWAGQLDSGTAACPAAVIPSHANEAATKDSKLLPDTKTAAFKAAVHVPTYLPLSGKTMKFDANGKCAAGC